jgi:hypothetical protein
MTTAILTAAYGRDYKNKAEVLKDWEDGKDFVLHTLRGSAYVNSNQSEQLKKDGFLDLKFRYNKNLQFFFAPLR